MQQRYKWMFEKNNVKFGDLVFLIEMNLPPYKWLLGRIIQVYLGDDNKIRAIKVKTQFSTCKRAISKRRVRLKKKKGKTIQSARPQWDEGLSVRADKTKAREDSPGRRWNEEGTEGKPTKKEFYRRSQLKVLVESFSKE
ncbi:hypothetical protein TNCV_1333611 [Trichonephila clavipes]|nr:hypothetical protein TNCV_1333611 [Trichonephila clavipes]